MSIKQIFEETFKGKNIMTPDIIEYRKVGDYFVELSSGRGFGGGTVYGVTVLEETEEGYSRSSLSKCLFSASEAYDYIYSLADFEEIGDEERVDD